MEEFKGKVILITGSSSGLGAGMAEHMAARGARLSLTGRDVTKLQEVVQRCRDAGAKEDDVLTTPGDLTEEEFRGQLIAATVERFGKLDVLVNNAGGVVSGMLSDPGMESYQRNMDLNLTTVVALSKLAIPHLLTAKGNIVNISSHSSEMPHPGMGAYCMSKVALDMFTKVLAQELGPKGVRVNSVNPGVCRTDVFKGMGMDGEHIQKFLDYIAKTYPVRRAGEAEDIARAVAFLASDKSSFITGETLVVDGGGR